MSLSHRTKDCACGSGTVCQAITAAFYMIRDPRRGYIELPPFHPPVSQYYEQQNRIRNAYLRHLCPYRIDFPDDELPRNIALHHFHPEIVLEFAQQRHLSSRKVKVPLTITREEMERLQLGLGEEDRVLDLDGRPTDKYYFCPNYPMKNVQQDLKECVRRERNKRAQTESSKAKDANDQASKLRSRSHSRTREESANKPPRVSIQSQSQSRAIRPDSRGHASMRRHELLLPPPPPQRYAAVADEPVHHGEIAVPPTAAGRLPQTPRDRRIHRMLMMQRYQIDRLDELEEVNRQERAIILNRIYITEARTTTTTTALAASATTTTTSDHSDRLAEVSGEWQVMKAQKERRDFYQVFLEPCSIVITEDDFIETPHTAANSDCEAPAVLQGQGQNMGRLVKLPQLASQNMGRLVKLPQLASKASSSKPSVAGRSGSTKNVKQQRHRCRRNAVPSSCAICLADYEAGDAIVWAATNKTNCSHVFHQDCMLNWLSTGKKQCPVCRDWFVPKHLTDV